MVNWNLAELATIDLYRGKDLKKTIPLNEQKYKCHTCYTIFRQDDFKKDGICPNCNETQIQIMCPLDHCNCHCNMGLPQAKIEYCPICGKPICPDCGTHDVEQISRVTGYLQSVAGWNQAKQQELRDRTHYDVV